MAGMRPIGICDAELPVWESQKDQQNNCEIRKFQFWRFFNGGYNLISGRIEIGVLAAGMKECMYEES